MSYSKKQKYDVISSDTITIDAENGKKFILARIKSLRSFGPVQAGDLGGYIDNFSCLSQDDDCWIYDNAKVFNGSKVRDNAIVMNNSIVNASNILNHGMVCGSASIYQSTINDTASVSDNVIVKGALVTADAWLKGHVLIDANITIKCSSEIVTFYANLDIKPVTLCPKHNYINTERFNGSVFDFFKRVVADHSFAHYKVILPQINAFVKID